ncbi:6420_t:CDS:2 [Ambispora gerdemannii]|uniref:6420_t:CDS:1 n=1 Tax=Ambispora gerdemannii TaxID=144530 RepID=A0A9N8ZIT9_9GLOM|nr:6420_t:CDS:2 [Ambispora gerdemannii]
MTVNRLLILCFFLQSSVQSLIYFVLVIVAYRNLREKQEATEEQSSHQVI